MIFIGLITEEKCKNTLKSFEDNSRILTSPSFPLEDETSSLNVEINDVSTSSGGSSYVGQSMNKASEPDEAIRREVDRSTRFDQLVSEFQRSWDELSDSDSRSEVNDSSADDLDLEGGEWARRQESTYSYSTLSRDPSSFISTSPTRLSSLISRNLSSSSICSLITQDLHLTSSARNSSSASSSCCDGTSLETRDSPIPDISDDQTSQLQLTYDRLNSYCSSIESLASQQFTTGSFIILIHFYHNLTRNL